MCIYIYFKYIFIQIFIDNFFSECRVTEENEDMSLFYSVWPMFDLAVHNERNYLLWKFNHVKYLCSQTIKYIDGCKYT